MNKCLKCGELFKNRILINGLIKVVNSRKYCLICSPFGQRNTKKLHLPERNIDSKKKCPQCGRKFKWNKNNVCWSCRSTKRRKQNRQKALNYLGHKCRTCGIEDKDVLTFHHKNQNSKYDNLSSLWHRNWNLIQKEIKKCELLCANCHMKLHRKENQ